MTAANLPADIPTNQGADRTERTGPLGGPGSGDQPRPLLTPDDVRPRTRSQAAEPEDRYRRHLADVWNETGDRCWYCGAEGSLGNRTIDHVFPTLKGGADARENFVACCLRCNGTKGVNTIRRFRSYMARAAAKWPYFNPDQARWLEEQGFKPPPFQFFGETIGLTLPPGAPDEP